MRSITRDRKRIVSHISSKQALFALVFLLCFFLAYLHLKIELIEVGYEIADNRNSEKKLIEDKEILQATFLNLKSPQRIEPLAINLGLRYPTPYDIVYINGDEQITAKK